MKSTQGPIDSWRTETFTTEALGRGNLLGCNKQDRQEYETSSHTKPRPGRRRHSDYQLPFSPAFTFLFTWLVFLLLCVPTEAAHQQRPGTWKLRGKVIERIEDLSFDLEAVPELRLHRRQPASTIPEASTIAAPTSSNGASNTNVTPTSSVPATSIISAAPSNTNSPLPKPFDGGIGTNFTQPSCPTFLNAMINNETFTSCLPFSLLLQVTHQPLHPSPPTLHPLTTLFTEFRVLLLSNQNPSIHKHRPQCLLLRHLSPMLLPHVHLRHSTPLLLRLRPGLRPSKSPHPPSLRRPPLLRHPLPRFLSQKHPQYLP